MMTANQYILRCTSYALLLALLVVGVNYVIDPYGITNAPRISNLNTYKADINDYTRQLKKYQPLFSAYDTLVLGNSRAEMGIDPAHQCFAESDMHVYNLAMPGAGIRMQLNYALNVMYQQPIKRVFLSVDFIDFISTEQEPLQRPSLLAQETGELRHLPDGELNVEYPLQLSLDYYRSLFSLDALVSSVKTVAGQRASSPDRDTAGFNPARDLAEIVRVEGARALYDQKMQNLAAKYSQPWYLRDTQGQLRVGFDDIEQFMQVAAQNKVEVVLFTHPFHSSYWQLMQEQGHMPAYEDWLTEITALAARYPKVNTGFWDFAGDSPYIHEVFPAEGVRNQVLKWFWEPAHYRKELGDLMVSAMVSPLVSTTLRDQCNAQTTFGRRIF